MVAFVKDPKGENIFAKITNLELSAKQSSSVNSKLQSVATPTVATTDSLSEEH